MFKDAQGQGLTDLKPSLEKMTNKLCFNFITWRYMVLLEY